MGGAGPHRHRAGFSIEWQRTRKLDYLSALSAEIASPGRGILDHYLLPFVDDRKERPWWGGAIGALPGLDGQSIEDTVEGDYKNVDVSQKYREFIERRAYRTDLHE